MAEQPGSSGTPVASGQFVVLVTRPAHQQADYLGALEAAGAVGVSFPLIVIEPLEDTADLQTARRQVMELDRFDLLIFISTNAVSHGAGLIEDYWPQFPVGVRVLGIGPATTDALRKRCLCEVETLSGGATSEEILQSDLLSRVEGMRIAIFRGQGGRELLKDTLVQRGAQVEYIEVYRRVQAGVSRDQLKLLMRQHGVNILTATSTESLRSLADLLQSDEAALELPLLVPSRRVAEAGRACGFSHVIDMGGADSAALIAALAGLADK